MASSEESATSRKRKRIKLPTTGPYVLKSLLENVPLSADDENGSIEITCAELWGISQI